MVTGALLGFCCAFLGVFIFTAIPAIYEITRNLVSHNPGPDPNDLPALLDLPLLMGAIVGAMTFFICLVPFARQEMRGGDK